MWIASFALAAGAGWVPSPSALIQDGGDDPGEAVVSPRARAVVVLLMDDVSYGDLGCSGSPLGLTPHIDRLSADGVRFSRAYATAATCSPSRAAILTGRYQQRFGHEFNPQHKADSGQGFLGTHANDSFRGGEQSVLLEDKTRGFCWTNGGPTCMLGWPPKGPTTCM